MGSAVGRSVRRKESWEKVTGRAKYTDDMPICGYLAARILTSPHAHAKVVSINTSKASGLRGVLAVITGQDTPGLCGVLLQDRPHLAVDVVRYAGEPVAIVVAQDEHTALLATGLIEVEYEPLPHLLTPGAALQPNAPLLHSALGSYMRVVDDIYPQAGSNVAGQYYIRKGNMATGWARSEVVIEEVFSVPPADHLAMEIRAARAEISYDGMVTITTSSQAPYAVRRQLAESFAISEGKIQVNVPFLGGGFGGKAPVMLEQLAYIASKKVGGRPVRLCITREQDMATAPCRMGLEASIKLGASRSGNIQAAQMRFLLDCGAYADIGPYMSKSLAADCTGPYRVGNLYCESLCVYTNHTFATSYRGFAHAEYTFCIERAIDKLAEKLNIDPLELRLINAIQPGDQTPTQVEATSSNTGSIKACLQELRSLAGLSGRTEQIDAQTVRAQGVACLWKAANPPTNAISGAMVTFNGDGSINLNTGVVEMGSAGQTHLAQILAEKLGVDTNQIHPELGVNTRTSPEHYKTVASMTGYMAGNAVLKAADDIISQIRANAAQALGCRPEDIVLENGSVYAHCHPEKRISFADIASGYKSPDGSSVGEPVLGRGGFILSGLSPLNPLTGEGRTGPYWTVGAQAVEVEYNRVEHTYRIVRASTVMDVGALINPEATREMIRGAMAMGISMSSREGYTYDAAGRLRSPTLRTYKLLHIGQEPEYRVGFVQTPQDDSPYGARSTSEHGIIGIPAALANALAAASGIDIRSLPLTPEALWRQKEEQNS